MSVLTMFSTCRPFEDIYEQIQLNALASWARMKQEIILFGNEAGIAEACKKYSFRHVSKLRRNKKGTPLVGAMFKTAESLASNNILCYSNADIVLHGLVDAVRIVAKKFDRFLVIGRRWDAGSIGVLKFSSNWQEKIKKGAKLHAATGIDFFAFTKGVWPEIPPFALGRWAWDNWLVDNAVSSGIDVIDATKVVTAVHQEHPHYPRRGEQWKANQELFGDRHGRGTANHTNWILGEQGLKRR